MTCANNGEIGDIVSYLYYNKWVGASGYVDRFSAYGWTYCVQKEWSNRDRMPVAFAWY